MKRNLTIYLFPVVLLAVLLATGYKLHPQRENPGHNIVAVAERTGTIAEVEPEDKWVQMPEAESGGDYATADARSILQYAQSLLGSPYLYSGITPDGFDCSGFVTHVFDKFAIDVPHSSAMQANEGVPIAKHQAAPGDLIIFTGTDENDRTPGHVGIVVSEPGDTISFVHSSSNGGVKISKVQGTRYNVRFLEVRRIL